MGRSISILRELKNAFIYFGNAKSKLWKRIELDILEENFSNF